MKAYLWGLAHSTKDWPLGEPLRTNATALEELTKAMLEEDDVDGDNRVSLKEFTRPRNREDDDDDYDHDEF